MKNISVKPSLKPTVCLPFVLVALLGAISAGDARAQATNVGDLPTLKHAPNRDALEAALERSKSVVQRYKGGHVVVGRVLLDGPGDPREVSAQMEILDGGYFVGPTKDLVRPIGFQMHQYAPLEVRLEGKSGEVVDLGVIHLTHLKASDLGNLTGHIALAGGKDATLAKVALSVSRGPVNTPSNGSSPRSRWPKPILPLISSDGKITATGFSPMSYWCSIDAPGYVSQSREVKFTKGQTFDLGTVTLDRPQTITLNYVTAETPPFDLQHQQQASVKGGERWKATPDIYGWDLEFKQTDGKLFFNYFYAPCSLTDLGSGTLADFAKTGRNADSRRFPSGDEIKSGHVYLLNQGHWKRWVLFSVDIK